VIAGDPNTQYPGWGSTRSNFVGVSFNEYLMQSLFIVLNGGCGMRIPLMLIMLIVLMLPWLNPILIHFHEGDDPLRNDQLKFILNLKVIQILQEIFNLIVQNYL